MHDCVSNPTAQDKTRQACHCGRPMGSVTDHLGTKWWACETLWESLDADAELP